jgi:hypothetical protein
MLVESASTILPMLARQIKHEWRELHTDGKSHRVSGESRTEYERDRDWSNYSTPIRRLMGKTQVFPLDPSDFVRTRLVPLWITCLPDPITSSKLARIEFIGRMGRRKS